MLSPAVQTGALMELVGCACTEPDPMITYQAHRFMPHDLSTPQEYTGQLLLAVPSLRDPNFSRSVIFLAAHSTDEGAFGYILNRPLRQRVADLMPDAELGPLGNAPVYMGGPVSADKLAFASLRWSRTRRQLQIQTHLSVDDALHEMSLGREVRGFVGYSGWGEGQLEKELERRSWIATVPGKQILNTRQPDSLWREILEGMGPLFGLISRMPEKVELN
jgi:putative transcriptional regulator